MPRITPIAPTRLRRVFEKAGFSLARTEGDHFVYVKEGIKRPIVGAGPKKLDNVISSESVLKERS